MIFSFYSLNNLARQLLAQKSAFCTIIKARSLASVRIASFIFLILSSIFPATISSSITNIIKIKKISPTKIIITTHLHSSFFQQKMPYFPIRPSNLKNQIKIISPQNNNNIMRVSTLSLLALIFTSVHCISNPGILISLPFPQHPSPITIPLPIPINDTLIANLQLTHIALRQVLYDWKLYSKYVEVNITKFGLTFNWIYKGHSGQGSFSQQKLKIDLNWLFSSKNNHLFIDIPSTKITPGHSKVFLTGGAPQLIIAQVTNLILNYASVLFRGFLAKVVSSAVSGLTAPLGQDRMIYTDSGSGKQFYLNTSLVTNPLFSGQVLILQINGAPYILGEPSGQLSPEEILVKTSADKIQVQIHKKLIVRMIELIKKARGILQIAINSMEISSVLDIDTIVLASVFPQMATITPKRSVIFYVIIDTIDVSFQNNSISFLASAFAKILTLNAESKKIQPYIDQFNGSASVQISPIFNKDKASIRIKGIEIIKIEPSQADIDGGKVVIEMISKYFGVLMEWVQDSINIGLNKKVIFAKYQDIDIALNGRVLNSYSYYLEMELQSVQ